MSSEASVWAWNIGDIRPDQKLALLKLSDNAQGDTVHCRLDSCAKDTCMTALQFAQVFNELIGCKKILYGHIKGGRIYCVLSMPESGRTLHNVGLEAAL